MLTIARLSSESARIRPSKKNMPKEVHLTMVKIPPMVSSNIFTEKRKQLSLKIKKTVTGIILLLIAKVHPLLSLTRYQEKLQRKKREKGRS
jgi:hypothetical protein